MPVKHPSDLEGLISFWDFQERRNGEFPAHGDFPYTLQEKGGKIEQVSEGLFGTHALQIIPGQWLQLPREQTRRLNIHGKAAQVTVLAWIRWNHDRRCQFIAGLWDESRKKRQYGLFLNLTGRYNSWRNVHGHVSGVGGPTPGQDFCVTYATGATEIAYEQWQSIGMTYDGKHVKVYVNGRLDQRPSYNPYLYEEGLFDGGSDGADFTVAACSAGGRMSNFYGGLLGGLAIYDRALSEEEITAIQG